MSIIKALMQPARLSFAVSLVSIVALVLLLVTHDTAHGDISDPVGAVDKADSPGEVTRGLW